MPPLIGILSRPIDETRVHQPAAEQSAHPEIGIAIFLWKWPQVNRHQPITTLTLTPTRSSSKATARMTAATEIPSAPASSTPSKSPRLPSSFEGFDCGGWTSKNKFEAIEQAK